MSPESVEASPRFDACSKCDAVVDPLRAARVRLIRNRFFYFCSQHCAETFSEEDFRSSPPPGATSKLMSHAPRTDTGGPGTRTDDTRAVTPRPQTETQNEGAAPSENAPPNQRDTASLDATETASDLRATSSESTRGVAETEDAKPSEADANRLGKPRSAMRRGSRIRSETLLKAALALGAASLTLLLAKSSQPTLMVRVGLTALATTLVVIPTLRERHQPEAPHPLELLALPVAATILAGTLTMLGRSAASSAATLATGLVLFSVVALLVIRRHEVPVARRSRRIAEKLAQPPTRIRGGQLVQVAPERIRPGEQIVIHAGETVPADVTVTGGRAEVHPWLDSVLVRPVEPGESLYAGARLVSGQLRATVRWTGRDRHWERLLSDPARRADRWAPLVVSGKRLVRRGAPLVLLLSVGASLLLGLDRTVMALQALALASAFSNPALYRLAALRTVQTVLDLLARGVVVRSAKVLDAAGRISTAIFCARGTLLLGEPELSTIESFSETSHDEILSLVVGAEQYGRHPIAVAVSRAARARGIRPDAVRTPQALPGLGVTAVTSDGKHLVVGSRALMMKERISVARAERRITEIEASGRTVLLAAVAHRLIGLVALQDGLRPGARAAVQHLLDAGIEPVLISGDARQTCEALGKTIDVDHIRPEVLPTERGQEIERLKSGGATVAVVGRSPADDIALSAASVAIALPSSGTRTTEFDVELASDEVQTAAVALSYAHRCRNQTIRGGVLIVSGAVLSCLLVIGLSAPPAVVPGVSILCTLLAELMTFSPAEGQDKTPPSPGP